VTLLVHLHLYVPILIYIRKMVLIWLMFAVRAHLSDHIVNRNKTNDQLLGVGYGVVVYPQLSGGKSQSNAHNTGVSDELVLYETDLTIMCMCS
jgi:hypothetical protein